MIVPTSDKTPVLASHCQLTSTGPLAVISVSKKKVCGNCVHATTTLFGSTVRVMSVTLARGGSRIGRAVTSPLTSVTIAEIQQKPRGLPGSRIYHQVEGSLRPSTRSEERRVGEE